MPDARQTRRRGRAVQSALCDRCLSPSQRRDVLTAALEREDSEYARHGIWLLLLTGLRMRELPKAKWHDVDWEMGTLFIGLTKNGEPLLAPLSDVALGRLKAIPRIAGNPYIICGQKPADHFQNLGPALKRVKLRAGLENLRVHDLNWTSAGRLGFDGFIAAELIMASAQARRSRALQADSQWKRVRRRDQPICKRIPS